LFLVPTLEQLGQGDKGKRESTSLKKC